MNDRTAFAGSWVLALIIITWISFSQKQGLPQPSRIIKTCAVWTILGVISEGSSKLAALMGFGLLIPLFLIARGANPNSQNNAGNFTTQATGNIAALAITGGA